MQNSIDPAGLTGNNDWKTWFSKVVSIAYEISLQLIALNGVMLEVSDCE